MYRIYLKDAGGTCLRSTELSKSNVLKELPKFTERALEYMVESKLESYTILIIKS